MRTRFVAARPFLLAVFGLASTAVCSSWFGAAGADEMKCGAHQHLVAEKDPDEGGTVKRCVCDEGWDADGPNAPCRQSKAAKDAAKKGGRKAAQ